MPFHRDPSVSAAYGVILYREIFSLPKMAIYECGQYGKAIRSLLILPFGLEMVIITISLAKLWKR